MPLDFNKIKELNKIKPVETKPTTGLDFDAIRQKNLPTTIPTSPDYTQYAKAFMEPVGITKPERPTVTTDIGQAVLQGPTSVLADPSKARIVTPTQRKLGAFAAGVIKSLPMLGAQPLEKELYEKQVRAEYASQAEQPGIFQAGRIAGSIPKYAVGYAALGPAVEAAAAPVVSKLPSIAQPFVTEMAKDIAIGAPLALTEELAEGKTGKDLVKAMTLNTAIDAVANLVFLGAGKFISGLRKQDVANIVAKEIQADKPVKDIGQRVLDELEATYKETLPKFGTPYYQAADLTRPTAESMERISQQIREQTFRETAGLRPTVSDIQLQREGLAFEPRPLAQDIRALEQEYADMVPILGRDITPTQPIAPSAEPIIREGVVPKVDVEEIAKPVIEAPPVEQANEELFKSLDDFIKRGKDTEVHKFYKSLMEKEPNLFPENLRPSDPRAKRYVGDEWKRIKQVRDRLSKTQPSVQKSVLADTPRMSVLESLPEPQKAFIGKLTGIPEQAIKITPTKVPTEGFYKRSDIVDNLSSALDIPIEKGKFRQKAFGIFKVQPEIIRVKNKKQLDTVLHEAGHYIDKKLNFSDVADYADELYQIGLKASGPDYSRDDIIKEGVAEFFADYGHSKEMAQKNAPRLFEYIENVMKQNPDLNDLFDVTRQGIQNYRNLDPVGNVLSNVQMTPKRRAVPKAQELFNSFYDNWVDDLSPINRAIRTITGGEAIKDTDNAYILHRLAKTSGVGKAEVAFEKGVVDAQGNVIGKGMNDILKPVADDFEEFIGYAVAKRAKELEQRGVQTGMDVGSVDKVLQKFEGNKVFNDALDELYNFQDTVLLELQKSGMITEEAFNSIKEMNKNYIPFYRVMENASGVGPSKGQPIKRIKGSEKDILNPINSIMKNTYAIYNIIDKNNANRALFDLAGKYEGFGKVFDKIPAPMRTTTFNLADLEKQLRDLGVEGDIDQMVSIFRPDAFSNRDDIVKIFRDGKPEYYQIFDQDLAQTLAYSNANQRNLLTKILGAPARVLRAGATALNPDFVGRNIFRDTVMASVMSKYGFIPVVDSLSGISDVLGKTDLYQKALASGALNNSIVSLDRNYLSKDMRKMFAQDQAGRVKNIIKHPVDMIRALSELSEEATRMGQFKKATKKLGMSDEAITRAALETRDLLDFHRAGRMGRNVNQYIPFFNATIQGTDKVARAFKENPVGMTAKATAAITLPSIALYMMNKGNPEYENLSQYEKDMYWNIPTNMYSHLAGVEKDTPTTVYRIPKPFELGVMYGTTPERLLDYIYNDNPEAFEGLRRRYIEAFMPSMTPTFFSLPFELQSNYSKFYDAPIVPESKQELEPAEQYGARTSESAKFLGRIFNQSPYKIDYAIRGLTGGTGPTVIGAAEAGLGKLGVLDVPEKPAVSLPGKLPILKGLTVSEYAQPKQIEDFYERFNELTTQYNTARARNRLEEMPEQDVRQYKVMSRISSRMSALNKEKTRIYQNMQMTGEQKRQALQEIEKQQLELIALTEQGT